MPITMRGKRKWAIRHRKRCTARWPTRLTWNRFTVRCTEPRYHVGPHHAPTRYDAAGNPIEFRSW